jgi:hypothetical protein
VSVQAIWLVIAFVMMDMTNVTIDYMTTDHSTHLVDGRCSLLNISIFASEAANSEMMPVYGGGVAGDNAGEDDHYFYMIRHLALV